MFKILIALFLLFNCGWNFNTSYNDAKYAMPDTNYKVDLDNNKFSRALSLFNFDFKDNTAIYTEKTIVDVGAGLIVGFLAETRVDCIDLGDNQFRLESNNPVLLDLGHGTMKTTFTEIVVDYSEDSVKVVEADFKDSGFGGLSWLIMSKDFDIRP